MENIRSRHNETNAHYIEKWPLYIRLVLTCNHGPDDLIPKILLVQKCDTVRLQLKKRHPGQPIDLALGGLHKLHGVHKAICLKLEEKIMSGHTENNSLYKQVILDRFISTSTNKEIRGGGDSKSGAK